MATGTDEDCIHIVMKLHVHNDLFDDLSLVFL